MDENRIADIRAGAGRTAASSGTGYLVGPSLVLTARHVLIDKCDDCRRRGGENRTRDCTNCALWPSVQVRIGHPAHGTVTKAVGKACWQHPAVDLALLRIEPRWPSLEPVKWGRPIGAEDLEYKGYGFPRLAEHDDRRRYVEPLRGSLNPATLNPSGYALDQDYFPVDDPEWKGVSGTAVFSNGHLVAVVSLADLRFDARRLRALPASQCVDDHDFVRLLSADTGTIPECEPVGHHDLGGPFERLDRLAAVFGNESNHLYRPERREYQNGEIQISEALAETVRARLDQGCCVIRGKGTTGKTTLAVALGLRNIAAGGQTYYASVANIDSRYSLPEIQANVSALSHRSTLLILDDVHSDEGLAARILSHWDRIGSQAAILLLGRTPPERAPGIDMPDLSRYDADPVLVELTADDLLATYRRVVRSYSTDADGIATPKKRILEKWLTLFGGDRIAFTVALRHRIETYGLRRWIRSGSRLEADDSIGYIKARYLDKQETRDELVKVAACSELELSVPEECLSRKFPEEYERELGIVHRSSHGRHAQRRYSLAHAGLGKLIMSASRRRDTASIYIEMAKDSPLFGYSLAARLDTQGRAQEAADVLRAIVDATESLALAMEPITAVANCQRIDRLGILSLAEMDERLSRSGRACAQICDEFSIEPGAAARFLRFAVRRMPATHARIVVGLADRIRISNLAEAIPENLAEGTIFLDFVHRSVPPLAEPIAELLASQRRITYLADTIPESNLGNSTTFLEVVAEHMPGVAEAIARKLSDPKRISLLVDEAMPRSNLGNSATFLKFAHQYMDAVAKAIARALKDPERISRLLDDAMPRSNLGNSATFLEVVDQRMPAVAETINGLLAEPGRIPRLADAITQDNLGNSVAYLEFIEKRLPQVTETIIDLLAEPQRITQVADAIPKGNLGNCVAFLGFADRITDRIAGKLGGGLGGNSALAMRDALAGELSDRKRITYLADAIPNDLGSCMVFLEYVDQNMPVVADALATELEDDKRVRHLADAIPNELGQSAVFLEFIDQRMPHVADTILRMLAEPPHLTQVADAVPTGNLGSCVSYLEFVGKRMPGMADAIIDRLGDPERVTRLADAALGNMQNTFTFLQFAFAQMPSIARRMAAMLAEPKRAVALGVNPETEGIKLYAIFRILELMDLYDPELAKQIVLLSPEAAKTTWAAYYYGDDDGPHISVGQGG